MTANLKDDFSNSWQYTFPGGENRIIENLNNEFFWLKQEVTKNKLIPWNSKWKQGDQLTRHTEIQNWIDDLYYKQQERPRVLQKFPI